MLKKCTMPISLSRGWVECTILQTGSNNPNGIKGMIERKEN